VGLDVEADVVARGLAAADFVPPGWAVEQRLEADLDLDGRGDLLLLLRGPGPADRSPPRMLAIVLAEPAGYRLAASNAVLIPQADLQGQEDPLADGELVALGGGFDLKLTLISGQGSYLSATSRYAFRHRDGCFRLVTYDRLQTHRATLDTEDRHVDFLDGTVRISRGNARSDEASVLVEALAANPRRCFEDLGSAAGFSPL
ncbi:MAG TPA: hypothetical protein PL196_10550, partial [Burkholderiaceae bacterium]|nr:hypothetical protein [Burkholderiaceae bacterium]